MLAGVILSPTVEEITHRRHDQAEQGSDDQLGRDGCQLRETRRVAHHGRAEGIDGISQVDKVRNT